MTDAGFFKGTSAEQDARFADKKKKLMKTMKFGDNLSQKVDMTRVKLECIRPWIVKRITELLNFEDEHPDPKEIQINITGFLNSKNARIFLTELWDLLLSAMENPEGVPDVLLDAKKAEILHRQEEEKRVQRELGHKRDELHAKDAFINTKVSTIPVVCSQNTSATQLNGSSPRVDLTASMEPQGSAADIPGVSQKAAVSSRRRRSSSSPSPRPRRKKNPKHESGSHRDESKHRRRRRSDRSPSSSVSSTDVPTKRHRSRQRFRRSRTSDSDERIAKKRPDSDWRKDLMAGRRRSPPEMPENSYYGYEKHKSRKRSSDRYRIPQRELSYDRSNIDICGRHGRKYGVVAHHPSSPVEVCEPKHRLSYEEHRADYVLEEHKSHRKNKHKHQEPNISDIKKMVLNEPSELDGRTKQVTRQTRLINQDENVMKVYGQARERKEALSAHLFDKKSQKRHRSPNPEGPALPPELLKTHPPASLMKRKSSSSSSSRSESDGSGSSSDDSSSGSSSGSSSSSDSESLSENAVGAPEGPTLPPCHLEIGEPEGPPLPPASLGVPNWTDNPKHNVGSSSNSTSFSASENSCENSDSSSVSGSESSCDSSSTEQSPQENLPNRVQKGSSSNRRNLRDNKPEELPEGPALPPKSVDAPRAYYENVKGKRIQSQGSKRSHDDKRGETDEEALRKRALASLMRASKDRRRARSPT